MPIENIPEIYLDQEVSPDLFIYDFKMTSDIIKSKVNLGMNMFSFLQVGEKQVHFAGTSVAVNKDQSLILKKGNWLWTEYLSPEALYYCKLLFFSKKALNTFLKKYSKEETLAPAKQPFFIISNDLYITSFINSLSVITNAPKDFKENILLVKFEELLLYLIYKYGSSFESYLQAMVRGENSSFRDTIDSTIHSNLRLEEIAFLCNMSLSTFKRHFAAEYKTSPGKWLKNERLERAKYMLEKSRRKPSEIYHELGYSNLSNFSIAFRNKFGVSPREVSE